MSLKTLGKRAALIAASAAVVLPVLAFAAPASADSNGVTRTIAMAGSDTTALVMEAMANAYNQSSRNTDRDRVVNIPPLHAVSANQEAAEALAGNVATKGYRAAARMGWPSGALVPGDADCKPERLYGGEGAVDVGTSAGGNVSPNGDIDVSNDTYATTVDLRDINGDGDYLDVNEKIVAGLVAPNGSGSGRSAALDEVNNPEGCLDIVRSSSAPSAGTQQGSFDTWGFALDAVGWVYFPGNDHRVTSLTKSQLTNVYTCVSGSSPTVPNYESWGDLSGDATDTDRIKPYRIQPGSGTANDVATLIMGLANGQSDSSFTNCGADTGTLFPTVQEHDCTAVATLDKPDAICFYGYSRWRIQASGIEVDKRNGAKFGRFAATDIATPLYPSGATINETAGRYAGTRLVYNLVYRGANGSTTMPSFNDALDVVGVRTNADGGTLGFACNGAASARIIRLYGLIPLKLAPTDASGDYPQSYCRHNKYSL